jgi:hypothetical protein
LTNDGGKCTILATRKDTDVTASKEGVDYYTRLVDVIEWMNQRRTHDEAALADRYRRAISKLNYRTCLSPGRRNSLASKSLKIDVTWKDGRKHFPKKSSMVGEGYQVSSLPSFGSYVQAQHRGNSEQYVR